MIAHSEVIRELHSGVKRLNGGCAGMRMSVEEFRAIDDYEPGFRYELIHGVVVVTPPPAPSHANSGDELGHLLRLYADNHPSGGCIDANLPEFEVVTTNTSVRRTDRCLWVGLGRKPDFDHDVPAIVVEFVSPGKAAYVRDYEDKRNEYLEMGCKEYWVIDRFRRTMTVFRNQLPPLVVPESAIFTTELLPGFELPLEKLLAAADKFKK
jgi:Uma2 family endonuclease